jgi:hypothetical protein
VRLLWRTALNQPFDPRRPQSAPISPRHQPFGRRLGPLRHADQAIAERYPSSDGYLEQVRQEARRLIDEGYLLAEDLEIVVDQASRRYGLLAAAREPVAAGE